VKCHKTKTKEFHELTNEELTELFTRATKKAIAEDHAAGRPTTHGNEHGIYKLYPDGRKEYITI